MTCRRALQIGKTLLYGLLDIPDKSPQTELLGFFINGVKCFQERFHTGIIYNSDDGGTHAWPSVTAVMRFARLGTTALHLLEVAESTAVQTVERGHDALMESLVEGDEY